MMYQFRKLDDGTWQRRESPRHPWRTLKVITNSRFVRQGNSRVERLDREWVWE